MSPFAKLGVAAFSASCLTQTGVAQVSPPAPPARTGWEVSAIPAVNYNSDEGFGYGAIAELYNYGAAGKLPYRFTLQPTVFLTTGGRRDFTLFFDAPNLGGSRWRVDAYVGHETQTAAPYYGIGNTTAYDKSLEVAPNEKYYRFGRVRAQVTTNLQRTIGESHLRVLFGASATHMAVTAIPGGTTTTYLSTELAGTSAPAGWSNYARVGLVWDSRDREVHTTRGPWADVLVQRISKSLGSDWDFTRATVTAREYVPLTPHVTLAERVVLQNVSGDAPFYELSVIQTSFKPQEGLGGVNSLRGIPRDRFVGKGIALANSELRWRASEFSLLGAPSSLTLSGFVDAGRVWPEKLDLRELFDDALDPGGKDWHVGYGGGVRVGRGPNFVVAFDLGRSNESAASMYLGLGFLF